MTKEKPTYDDLIAALQWLMDGLSDDYPQMSEKDDGGNSYHDYHFNAGQVLILAGGHVADRNLAEAIAGQTKSRDQ